LDKNALSQYPDGGYLMPRMETEKDLHLLLQARLQNTKCKLKNANLFVIQTGSPLKNRELALVNLTAPEPLLFNKKQLEQSLPALLYATLTHG
jgi:hypothetical protein